MANYRAVGNGNYGTLATWQDDSLGYFAASSVLPTSSDDVYSNNYTVTIDGTRNAATIRNTAFSSPTYLGSMAIPQMTSNTAPSGVASASAVFGISFAWNAFDRNSGTGWQTSTTGQTGWLSYQFPTGKIIKKYAFLSQTTNTLNPKTWTFEGSNNGSTWTTLDTQTNFVTGVSTWYSFDISSNTTSYTYYRVNVTATQGGSTGVSILELEMSEITNLYGSISAGGGFTFANAGNLTCSTSTNALFSNSTNYLVTFDLPSGQSATLSASCNTVPNIANGRVMLIQNTGTFNITGDFGLNNGSLSGRYTIVVNASTTINLIGNITNSQTASGLGSTTLYIIAGNPIINITGNVSGGNTNILTSLYGNAIYCATAPTINITGNITTNSAPSIFFNAAGTLNVTGNITGGTAYPAVYNLNTAATIDVIGITTSGSGYPAIHGLNTTFVKVRGNVVNTDTYAAILAGRVTIDNNVTSWQFKDSTNTITRTLYTPGVALGNPATNNVRFGTVYGSAGELTGTARVPSASSVLQGVPVDNTVGTLITTPAQFWNYLIASGFTANSIGDRLQNAATVASTGSQVASYNV